MKALFELFRRFDARRIFGFIRRLGGMSCPKVKCYDLRSTHALRVEGDTLQAAPDRRGCDFYPRPPLRRMRRISIHALRVEGDSRYPLCRREHIDFYPRPPGGGRLEIIVVALLQKYFYPRPPGGGRPRVRLSLKRRSTFLSTPSGWRATVAAKSIMSFVPISIHALRVEGDVNRRKTHKVK